MSYLIEIARNGEQTLKVNGKYIYSKYAPKIEATKWIEQEIDPSAEGYILIGLGLGYHLETILAKHLNKPIQVLAFYGEQYEPKYSADTLKIIANPAHLQITENHQILIPQAWLNTLSMSHPLYEYLLDIKMRQTSFKRFSKQMAVNFAENSVREDFNFLSYKNTLAIKKPACLVASGPSLDETVHWLKEIQQEVYILCVGSALKPLQQAGVQPDAVIISDCLINVVDQFATVNYKGLLFYLATANKEAVNLHEGSRCILLQHGYKPSERLAEALHYPLLETGGSVATTAYSLLVCLGFPKIIMFGQDLTVSNNQTHASNSSSNRHLFTKEKMMKVQSNSGMEVNTLPNLNSYKKWYEKVVPTVNASTYTTSRNGVYMRGVSWINQDSLKKLIKCD